MTIAPVRAGHGLIDDQTQAALSVGFLAARAAGAGRRVVAGQVLDPIDRKVLEEIEELFSSAAGALCFARTGGVAGILPRKFDAVALVIQAMASSGDQVERRLRWAADLVAVLRGRSPEDTAAQLVELFSDLSKAATTAARCAGGVE